MIGRRPDELMEPRVELRISERVTPFDPLAHLGDDLAQLLEVIRRRPLGRAPGQQALERATHLLDLQGLAIGDMPHSRSPVRLQRDQAFLVEPHQGGSDRCPTDSHALGDGSLDQPLVGVELAAHDCLTQLVIRV